MKATFLVGELRSYLFLLIVTLGVTLVCLFFIDTKWHLSMTGQSDTRMTTVPVTYAFTS